MTSSVLCPCCVMPFPERNNACVARDDGGAMIAVMRESRHLAGESEGREGWYLSVRGNEDLQVALGGRRQCIVGFAELRKSVSACNHLIDIDMSLVQ